MQEKNIRGLFWLGSLLLFFPLWIGLMHGVQLGLDEAAIRWSWRLPDWFRGLISFGLLALCLLGPAYLLAKHLDRRFPDSPPGSAAWDAGRPGRPKS